MNYRDAMSLCEELIARHKGEITAQELADRTGYSLYHFCHVFRAYFSMPPGEYIRKKALDQAAAEILEGSPVLEASLNAGYETPAGFSKAFRRQFGMSATEFRRQNQKRSDAIMQPKIEKKTAFAAMGYYVPSKEEKVDILESGAYWHGIDFSHHPQYPQSSAEKGEIGAWMHPSEKAGDLQYFFGYISDAAAAPEGFVKLEIPAAEYAIFDIPPAADYADGGKELAENIRRGWRYIFKEWFNDAPYSFDEHNMCFEFYQGQNTQIYIPVKAKA